MQVIFDLFNFLFFAPIVNLLVFILRVLEASAVPGALGLAIIFLTILIRILVWPFIGSQLKVAKKMTEIRPHLDELKKKHAQDKQALAKAQMELYKEHNINPAGGCLPTLIQIPVILALYRVISLLFTGDGINKINSVLYFPAWRLGQAPDPIFLGFNLASKPSEFSKVGYFILLVPIITALLQFMQSKMMAHSAVKSYPSDSLKEKKEKEDVEDAMSAMSSQMVYMMPLMIGFFSWQFPVGLALYWNTFTILGIWQQYLLSGWGGLEAWLKKLGLKK